MFPLEFFSAWSTQYRVRFPENVKRRKPHKFMRPYYGIIPKSVLNRERVKLENKTVQKAKTGTRHGFPMRAMYMLVDPATYIDPRDLSDFFPFPP